MKKRLKSIYNHTADIIKHYGWLSLVLIPIFILVNWAFFSTAAAQREAIESSKNALAVQELNNIAVYIDSYIASIHDDIHVIRDSNEVETYLEDESETNLLEVKGLVYRILLNKKNFINTSLLDSTGQELLRVSRINDELIQVDQSQLTNLSSEDYFQEVSTFSDHMLYIDQLKVIQGKPILTLVAPLFDDGHLDYYIVIEYNANSFLSVFNLFASKESNYHSIGLVQANQVWLLNQDDHIIYQVVDANQNNYYLNEVVDDVDTQSLIVKVNENDHSYQVFLKDDMVLFAQIDMKLAIQQSQSLALKYLWIIYPINIILLVSVIYFAYVIKSKSDHLILLNANMYLSDHNIDGVLITDAKLNVYYVNKAFEKFYGYSLTELYRKTPFEVIGEYGIDINLNTKEKNQSFETHVWNKTKNGIRILKYLHIKNEVTASGKTRHYIGIYSEPIYELEDYLKYSLTKEETIVELSKVFIKYPFVLGKTTLFMIKTFNHNGFDLAKYLSTQLNQKFILAIPKKNYLMIYYTGESKIDSTINLLDRLIDQYRHLSTTDRSFSHIFAICQSDEINKDYQTMIEALLITIELSKRDPRVKHHIYHHSMREVIDREFQIQQQLEHAFAHNEFYMAYQVQLRLSDNTYVGAEALLRWHNKQLGIIPPNHFIPIIENSFYINQLTLMVVKKVIEDITPHIKTLPINFRVSINLTEFDFNNDFIINQILELIDLSDVPNHFFAFEITESNYIDNIVKTNHIIERFHQADIIIAIDDFGTGYSSINYLKSMHVDQVKIDRTFIEKYPNHDDGAMFETMANLIHSLGKEVVAEGTETKEQIDFCVQNHCEMIQGYYISKPIVFDQLIKQFFNKKDID